MAQLVSTVTEVLKERILPVWNDMINIQPTPFLEKIKKVNLTNQIIRSAARVGLNGGFGFGTEAGDTPSAAPQIYEGFYINPVDMFAEIKFSDKLVALANTNDNAIIPAVKQEITGAFDACKWNLGRSLFMDSLGKLATVTANATPSNTVAVNTTQYLKEGLMIDFYETADAVGATPDIAKRRVLAVNDSDKTIVIDGTATAVKAGFITVQNSYGRETFGLGALFDATTFTSVYGVTRTSTQNTYLIPTSESASNAIDNNKIGNAIRNAERRHGVKTDLVMFGDAAFDSFREYMQINNVVVVGDYEFKSGAKGYEILYGSRTAVVVNEAFVPTTEIWGVDTSTFEYHSTGWNLANANGAPAFTLMESKSWYRALIASYGNLICSNPGGLWKLTSANSL